MVVLLVTGKLAEERVRDVAAKHGCQVFTAPLDVASLLTPKKILGSMAGLKDIDLVLVPGLMRGDLAEIEEALGVPTFKGPKDVADLDYVLDNLGEVKLSKATPACELLREGLKEKALREIERIDSTQYMQEMLKKPGNILVGKLAVGWDFPIRVLAEIPGIEDLSREDILGQGRYLLASGADILDLGISEANPDKVEGGITALRELGAPVSVDTMEPANIQRALECDVDLILSFDGKLIREFQDIKTPCVLIPRRGDIPSKPRERVRLLEDNIQLAEERGFKNIIADPILQPANMGVADSLVAYRKFSLRHPHEHPILFGAGNVTELFDADSVGINALLCSLASECSASIIFSVEASDKTRGSIRELATAAKMMYLSRVRGSAPKDLGLDLLVLKEKRLKRETTEVEAEKVHVEPGRDFAPDPKGYFKIYVSDKIRCVHFRGGRARLVIESDGAREISDTLLDLDLVSSYEHALYLGRELEKAEFALRYGKSYTQE